MIAIASLNATPRVGPWLNLKPNPAQGSAIIAFDVPEPAVVRLSVYDVTGRETERLVDRFFAPGRREIAWIPGLSASRHSASGVYFIELKTGNVRQRERLVLTR